MIGSQKLYAKSLHLEQHPLRNIYRRLISREDHWTDAFVDLLERVRDADVCANRSGEASKFGDLLYKILLNYATCNELREAFNSELQQYQLNQLSLKTRHNTGNGEPDIVIFAEDHPVCVIEVKINAPHQHQQLQRYGRWLDEFADDCSTPALVLLTQITEPPEGFADPRSDEFGVQLRSVARWKDIADWFGELSQEAACEPLKSLAGELAVFLQEQEVEMATLDDIVVARLYLAGPRDRLRNTVSQMLDGFEFPNGWQVVKSVKSEPVGLFKEIKNNADRNVSLYVGLGLKPSHENDQAIGGFTHYENSKLARPNAVGIGDGVYAFVYIWTADEQCEYIPGFTRCCWYERRDGALVRASVQLDVNSEGWWHYCVADESYGGYARICALHELVEDNGRIAGRLTCWTHEALNQALTLWSAVQAER